MYTQNSYQCSDITIPNIDNEDIDLYVKIVPKNEISTAYFASALICYNTNLDQRPLHGMIYVNFAKMEQTDLNKYFYYTTFMHEFVHILGFSGSQAGKFRNDEKTGARETSEFIGSKLFFLVFSYFD